MISPRHSRSTTTTRFSTRAGAQAPSRAYCSCNSWRMAESMAPGVVSCSLHMPAASVKASDRPPLVAGLEQRVGLRRARGARRVLHQRGVALPPRLEDRVDDPPLRLDLVVAGE